VLGGRVLGRRLLGGRVLERRVLGGRVLGGRVLGGRVLTFQRRRQSLWRTSDLYCKSYTHKKILKSQRPGVCTT